MNNKYITELTDLYIEQKILKRNLMNVYKNKKERAKLFDKINNNEEKIKEIKTKLKLLRRIKNENSNTSKSKIEEK